MRWAPAAAVRSESQCHPADVTPRPNSTDETVVACAQVVAASVEHPRRAVKVLVLRHQIGRVGPASSGSLHDSTTAWSARIAHVGLEAREEGDARNCIATHNSATHPWPRIKAAPDVKVVADDNAVRIDERVAKDLREHDLPGCALVAQPLHLDGAVEARVALGSALIERVVCHDVEHVVGVVLHHLRAMEGIAHHELLAHRLPNRFT